MKDAHSKNDGRLDDSNKDRKGQIHDIRLAL